MHGSKEYILQNTLFPRMDVRLGVIAGLAEKSSSTSYANTLDEEFIKKREKVFLLVPVIMKRWSIYGRR